MWVRMIDLAIYLLLDKTSDGVACIQAINVFHYLLNFNQLFGKVIKIATNKG
jgi:hypothetical protein